MSAHTNAVIQMIARKSCGAYVLNGTSPAPFGVTLNLSGFRAKYPDVARMYVQKRVML